MGPSQEIGSSAGIDLLEFGRIGLMQHGIDPIGCDRLVRQDLRQRQRGFDRRCCRDPGSDQSGDQNNRLQVVRRCLEWVQ